MAGVFLDTWEEVLRGSTTPDYWMSGKGVGQLTPNNLFENQYAVEQGEDGEPALWNLAWNIQKVIGYHIGISRPGSPRHSSVTRQTTVSIPPSEGSWTMEEPWVAGIKGSPTSRIKPPAPELETTPSGNKGFEGGTYPWAWSVSGEFGETTLTGVTFFTLTSGEFPKFPVPDSFPEGTIRWNIYMGRKGGGASTLLKQRSIPVERINREEYPVHGPRRNRGRPPATNQSGVGIPPAPARGRQFKEVPSDYNTKAGSWRRMDVLKTDRGTSLASNLSKPIYIAPSKKRVKVEGPAPTATVQGGPDPRFIRPSGKQEDNEYIGAEVDWEESRLVGLVNQRREEQGLEPLILTQALNRAAYKGTTPEEEGYPGGYQMLDAFGPVEEAIDMTPPNFEPDDEYDPEEALKPEWKSVGVAREGEQWTLVLGDYLEDDGITELVCEHYDAEGNLHTTALDEDQIHTLVSLGWDLVSNGTMGWSYSGSYSGAVNQGSFVWHQLGKVKMVSGGSQCAITDGSPNPGAMATTYSDGRMILSSYYFSRSTTNAKNACMAHEFGHTLGMGHYSGASVLRTPISINTSNNYESPTSYDRSEYTRLWGHLSGTTGGGTGQQEHPDSGGRKEIRLSKGQCAEWMSKEFFREFFKDICKKETGGSEEPGGEEPDPETEWHYEWRDLDHKEKAAFRLRPPRIARRRKVKWAPYLQHTDLQGKITNYRVILPGNPRGAGVYFHWDLDYVDVAGILPDEAIKLAKNQRAPRVRLVQEDPPTEDTTIIEPPDPTSVPDEPLVGGQEVPQASRYRATVQGVLEDGGLTQHSEFGRNASGNAYIDSTLAQLPKVVLPLTVNLLKNAEFGVRDSKGRLVDWITRNAETTDPGYITPESGILKIGVSTASGTAPNAESRLIPVNAEKSYTIAGIIGATRVAAGSIRAVLTQYDSSRVAIGSNVGVTDLTTPGEIPFVKRYGASPAFGGTALDPSCAFISLTLRLAGTTVNADGYFQNMRIFPFAADIGKYSVEDTVNFDPTPDTPAPLGSYALVGLPAEPQGAVSESEPPTNFTDFESGLNGWIEKGHAVASDRGIQAGAAIFGSQGYRMADTSQGASRPAYLEQTFAVTNTSALRAVYRVDTLPTTDSILLHNVRGVSQAAAWLRLDSLGRLYLRVNPSGSPLQEFRIGTINQFDIFDVEIQFVSGKNGIISVGFGRNGAQREIIFTRNFDFTNRGGNVMWAGVSFTGDPKTRYNLTMDNVVVTERGDILDREKPSVPTGFIPPPPDRPAKGAGYRIFEPDVDEKIRQLRAFVEPGAATPEDPAVIPLLEDPVNVRPGLSYTIGAFLRYSVFDELTSPGLRVWLESTEDEEPILAADIPMTGERGFHPTGEEDDFDTFTVPLSGGYTKARVEMVLLPGFYVMQEPLFTQGSFSLFADRDARRGYGRAVATQAEFILDSYPEAYDTTLENSPGQRIFWSELGVKEVPKDPPTGTLDVNFSTSSDLLSWAPYSTPRDTPLRYLRAILNLSGDGREGPEIADVFLRTWQEEGALLRKDGSQFPGGATVSVLLYETEYPDIEALNVGGHHQSTPTTEDISRIYEIHIKAFTEAALREIEALSLQDEMLLEIPGAGGLFAGKSYRVRMREQARFETEDVPPVLVDGYKRLYATCDIGEAEVLEASPLQPPMNLVASASELAEV